MNIRPAKGWSMGISQELNVAPMGGFSVAPKKGISVTPQKGFRILPEGRSSNAAVYKTKTGYSIKKRTRAPKARGPTAALNRYYERGGLLRITHIYSSRYAGMKGTSRLLPVNTEAGRGYLSTDGSLVLEADLKDLMVSLDSTTVGRGKGQWVLEKYWNTLTPQQRANVADALLDVDWDSFWKEFYPVKGQPGDIDTQYQMYDGFLKTLADATGRVVDASV